MSICNKDCFHCLCPDCINDEMDHEDYVESADRDRELRSTPEKLKLAAQKRAYYEANLEKIAAQQRIIRETRIAVGLSQVAAANILGVSKATISFWERGLVRCDSAAVVQALCCAETEKPPADAGTSVGGKRINNHLQFTTKRRFCQP